MQGNPKGLPTAEMCKARGADPELTPGGSRREYKIFTFLGEISYVAAPIYLGLPCFDLHQIIIYNSHIKHLLCITVFGFSLCYNSMYNPNSKNLGHKKECKDLQNS